MNSYMRVIYLFPILSLLFLMSFAFNHDHNHDGGLELTNPKWSPNGELLLASSEKYTGLYIIEPTSGKIKASYLNDLAIGYAACWSNDGKYVYYREKNKDYTFSLKKIDINTGVVQIVNKNPQLLTNKSFNDGLTGNIYLNYKQEVVKRTNANEELVVLPAEIDNYYHMISSTNNKYGVVHSGPFMFWVDFKTGLKQNLTQGLANAISPDGKTVYFHRDYSNNGHHISGAELFAVDVSSKKVTQLTNTKNELEMWPDISPDGTKIAYSDTKTGKIIVKELTKLNK